MTVLTGELVTETPYIWRARRPAGTIRLICLPHAGAGAAAYGEWARLLPAEVELAAIQLPGRQNRIAEEPFTDVPSLVNVLTHALRPVLDGRYALFGHSCGAALAYELAAALRARGRRGPERLFLSAQPAPGTPVRQVHDLPTDEFLDEMIALGGIDPEILDDDMVMESLLPTLRADFALWERHTPTPAPPLDCPITALAGDVDPRTAVHTVNGWQAYTTGPFTTRIYPGGHFYFLGSGAVGVVSSLARDLLSSDADRSTT